jgi:hypothetical protein
MEVCPSAACMSAAVVAPSTSACSRRREQGRCKRSKARPTVGDDVALRMQRVVGLGLSDAAVLAMVTRVVGCYKVSSTL